MIKDRAAISRYAEAFLNFAKENCGIDKALKDLMLAKNIIRDNPGFKKLMHNPQISYAQKCTFIDEVIKDSFSDEIRDFLKLLLDKERIDIFPEVVEYLRAKYSHHGQVDVLLRTAFPLDLDVIKRIQDALKKKFKQSLKFYIDLDGSLLGGVQVVVGNTIIDGSVKKRLEGLREQLTTARIN